MRQEERKEEEKKWEEGKRKGFETNKEGDGQDQRMAKG